MTRKEEKAELIYKDDSYAILGARFTVYQDKGCGFLEPVSLVPRDRARFRAEVALKIFVSFRVFSGP